MDGWQELVSNLVSSAAWPLVVLVLGLTFRRALRSNLGRLRLFEGLGAKVEFSETLKELEDRAEAAASSVRQVDPTSSAAGGISSPSPEELIETLTAEDHMRWIEHDAYRSPSARIIGAWMQTEKLLIDFFVFVRNHEGGQISPEGNRSLSLMIRYLWAHQYLDRTQVDVLFDLLKLRNEVAFGNTDPSDGQAITYAVAANSAIRFLSGAFAGAHTRHDPVDATLNRET